MKKTSRVKDVVLNVLITLGPVIIMGLIIVGLSALLALVMLPNYSPGGSLFLICLVAAVIAILAFLMVVSLVMFAKNRRYIWNTEDICLFVISIILAVIFLISSVVMFFVYDNLYGTGFESGDFSGEHDCLICSKPADGGMWKGGKEEDKYYCKDHYKRVSSSPKDKNFTNKYGTPNTECAVYGCTNKIVSSGDSNSCAEHSQKCLSCHCYIDYDAMLCIECVEDALQR